MQQLQTSRYPIEVVDREVVSEVVESLILYGHKVVESLGDSFPDSDDLEVLAVDHALSARVVVVVLGGDLEHLILLVGVQVPSDD